LTNAIVIGKGAFGTVYEAKSLIDGRVWAIKKIETEYKSQYDDGIKKANLLRELRGEHQNIIELQETYAFKQIKSGFYTLAFKMEKADQSLMDLIEVSIKKNI